MSTLDIEKDLEQEVRATEAVEIVDCGRASERTQGLPLLFFLEGGVPPFNTLLL
jgi:hypothetical protein